jgi:hypothetical protein
MKIYEGINVEWAPEPVCCCGVKQNKLLLLGIKTRFVLDIQLVAQSLYQLSYPVSNNR